MWRLAPEENTEWLAGESARARHRGGNTCVRTSRGSERPSHLSSLTGPPAHRHVTKSCPYVCRDVIAAHSG